MIDVTTKELHTIADKVLSEHYVEPVSDLPPDDIEALCYILTKKIKDLPEFKMEHWDELSSFLFRLNRYQIGMFWKIFNFFCRDRSTIWYKRNRTVFKKILESLICKNKSPLKYWAEVRNLEAVLIEYRVQDGILGMHYDH